ncbi:MAG: HypC/HybG/HupF family hydrogenase formation chaperone [Patescibacteria group bacterium]|nr:HypC/HybG/HupF family hydrogenase formation chaperone [Patescibacteria group bacterium]
MCFSIPGKIKSKKGKNIFIEYDFGLKKVKNSLCPVKKGDWVLVQSDIIVKKIKADQAKEILSLIGLSN